MSDVSSPYSLWQSPAFPRIAHILRFEIGLNPYKSVFICVHLWFPLLYVIRRCFPPVFRLTSSRPSFMMLMQLRDWYCDRKPAMAIASCPKSALKWPRGVGLARGGWVAYLLSFLHVAVVPSCLGRPARRNKQSQFAGPVAAGRQGDCVKRTQFQLGGAPNKPNFGVFGPKTKVSRYRQRQWGRAARWGPGGDCAKRSQFASRVSQRAGFLPAWADRFL